MQVNAEEVVPGDIVILEAGDRVPADARLFEANTLYVNEAMLTESPFPLPKWLRRSREVRLLLGTSQTWCLWELWSLGAWCRSGRGDRDEYGNRQDCRPDSGIGCI